MWVHIRVYWGKLNYDRQTLCNLQLIDSTDSISIVFHVTHTIFIVFEVKSLQSNTKVSASSVSIPRFNSNTGIHSSLSTLRSVYLRLVMSSLQMELT